MLTRVSGARHRVGYRSYRYNRLYNHAAPPSNGLWGRSETHSVEQQLALAGWTGIPVSDRLETRLAVTERATASITARLQSAGVDEQTPFALIHPAAAFESKQWAAENFARVAEELARRGLRAVAVAGKNETRTLSALSSHSSAQTVPFTDLSLPEVTALAARARLFIGNDSGIAHIATAVRTPSVVIFGSSNVAHWRPWKNPYSEVVREQLPCQPCPGYTCSEFDEPQCIRRVTVERVVHAIERVMKSSSQSSE
jgi:heptosyltransferase-2/heptosyltransferase-3